MGSYKRFGAITRAAIASARMIDPVCGTTISPDDGAGHIDYQGQNAAQQP